MEGKTRVWCPRKKKEEELSAEGREAKHVDGYQWCLGVKGDHVGPKLLISA